MELGIDDTREEVVLMRHVILSHHGLLEYGKPGSSTYHGRQIIHMIDNLDAKDDDVNSSSFGGQRRDVTNKIFKQDNRSFYKPDLD